MNSKTNQNQKQVKNSDASMSELKTNTIELQPTEAELFKNLVQLTKTLNSIHRDLIDTFGYAGDIVGPEGLIEYAGADNQYVVRYVIVDKEKVFSI